MLFTKLTREKKSTSRKSNSLETTRSRQRKSKRICIQSPGYFFSFITKRGLFKIEEIKRDSDRIKAVYIDNGYLDIKVSEPGIRYDEEKDGYVVSFSIEEGVEYKVSEITFSGELTEDEDEIRPELGLSPDAVFSSFVPSGRHRENR